MTDQYLFRDISNMTIDRLAEIDWKRYSARFGGLDQSRFPGMLVSESDTMNCVNQMAQRITEDYQGILGKGEALYVVTVLKGAKNFSADLTQGLDIFMREDNIIVGSYGDDLHSSGVMRLHKDLNKPATDQHVLLVEDIVDTGMTLSYIVNNVLARHKPRSVRTAAFLDKRCRRKVDIHPDYAGFWIPDMFTVGYGLDFGDRLRNLPFVAVYR